MKSVAIFFLVVVLVPYMVLAAPHPEPSGVGSVGVLGLASPGLVGIGTPVLAGGWGAPGIIGARGLGVSTIGVGGLGGLGGLGGIQTIGGLGLGGLGGHGRIW